MGEAVLFAICAIFILGLFAWGSKTFPSSKFWKMLRFIKVKSIHGYLRYGLIITAQVTIVEGVKIYNEETGNVTLGIVNISVFFLIWRL